MQNEAVKKKRKIIVFIWILPIIAVLISSWALFKHFNQLDEEITIIFNNAEGFVVDKTPLKYKGIKIGVVSDIQLDESNVNKFLVKVKLSQQTKEVVARKGNLFWKVEPKLSIGEVSGLNTLISGNYIEMRPKESNVSKVLEQEIQVVFEAIQSKPIDVIENGLLVQLKSDKGDLSIGSPVLYKSFVVGEVLNKALEGEDVVYTLFIKEKYQHLLKGSTNFWRVSGVEVKASLSGIKMNVENLETLIAGGIAFDSKKEDESVFKHESILPLYASKDDVGYSSRLVLLKAKEVYNLEEEFSKVFHKGFEIGKIDRIEYNAEESMNYIYLKIKNEAYHILAYAPHFQVITPRIKLTKVEGLSTLVKSHYIKVTTHSKSKKIVKTSYKLNENEKPISMFKVTLKTKNDTKISKDSPIYYKNIKVGFVSSYYLNKQKNEVMIKANIYWIYRDLINDSSLFYEQAPIEFKADLKGVLVKTAPIKSFILSGISFITNDLQQKSSKKSFTLYSNLSEVQKQEYLQHKGTIYKIRVENASEVKKGLEIYYKGMEIGRVLDSEYVASKDEIHFDIYILDEFSKLLNKSTRFYSLSSIDVDLSFDKVNIKTKSFYSMFNGGISFYTEDKNASKVSENHLFDFDKSLQDAEEKFVNAQLTMPRGFNLKQGSKILYKDVPIGTIQSMQFLQDDTIQAKLKIQKRHEKLLNKNTLFYLDKFKFSLSGIENPSGALFGSRIKVIAGQSNIKQDQFRLITYKPFEHFEKEGLRVVVHSRVKSSLNQNSPVYYRQLQIGAVEKYELSQDSTSVKLHLFIEKKYAHLVRKNSIFYNATAFGVDLYLFGVKIKTETLETMINGGISLVTPTDFSEVASNHDSFKLHDDVKEQWLEWEPKIVK